MELKETQQQLHDAEKLASIGQLAAGVAHEINNSLATIMMFSSILKKKYKYKDSNSIDDLNLIIEEAKRCKNIVSNLLDFARESKLKISNFNLIKLTEEILKKHLLDKLNCINVHLATYSPTIYVYAGYDQIKEVLLNIINNALEAMEETNIENLIISFIQSIGSVHIEISDTGCGIKDENIKKIFTPFFSTKKIGKGTGLGLSIAYGIIKMQKGNISVESQPDKGTLIKITLPLNQD